ncbi:hypothetical protein MKX01_014630 [Papaver californicum]|nr:hypothetical protein MKX01_014630 [Papaver californicum]
MEESSSVVFLVFTIIKMQLGTAAVSCDVGETNVNAARAYNAWDCRKKLQTNCGLQGRVVSHLEMNAWDPNNTAEKTCEGCCQVPLPCPVQPIQSWRCNVHPPIRINHCHRCQDGCKTRCDKIGARVGEQICGYRMNGKAIVGLKCTCCCRKRTPFPPPPPRPTPAPPRPTPRPPSPSTPGQDICRAIEDIYVAFRIFYPSSCSSCSSDCTKKCFEMGTFMVTQQCIADSFSPGTGMCKCCCRPSPPPSPPPPPSPWFPPPTTSPPPPPPENICDRFSEILYYNTNDCSVCLSDCQRQCSASSVTKQTCTVNPTSVLCKYCCKRNTGDTTSLLSLAAD